MYIRIYSKFRPNKTTPIEHNQMQTLKTKKQLLSKKKILMKKKNGKRKIYISIKFEKTKIRNKNIILN